MGLINTFKKLTYLTTGIIPRSFSIVVKGAATEKASLFGNIILEFKRDARVTAAQKYPSDEQTWIATGKPIGLVYNQSQEEVIRSSTRLNVLERMAAFYPEETKASLQSGWLNALKAPLACVLYEGEKARLQKTAPENTLNSP